MSEQQKPPPNPFYRRDYACSVKSGQAWLSLPFPGGSIEPQDAQDIIDWLQLIVRQLERHASPPYHQEPTQ